MNFYNVLIENIYAERVYITALDDTQLERMVNAFLNGSESISIKGVSRSFFRNKSFIIYSITSTELKGKTQEQIESQIQREKRFYSSGKLSLALYKRYGTNVSDKFTNGMGFGELKDKPIKSKPTLQKIKGKIFISHSTKNKEIVSKFCDLILNNGLNIDTTKEVFNTSLEGSKPESGEDFKSSIKSELENAKLVLQFISKEYKESEVCLNEMGAAWVLCENVIPLIIEENEYEVGFIHSTTQQVQLHKEGDIFRLIDDLKVKGIVSEYKVERLNQKIKEFVNWLKIYNQSKDVEKPVIKKNSRTSEVNSPKPSIFSKIDPNPFYKINKLASLYYFKESKFCVIPDPGTSHFLGLSRFKNPHQIEFSNEELKTIFGTPILSIHNGSIWINSFDNSTWLIYENKRHLIDGISYQIFTKTNPNILIEKVSPTKLHSLIEGDAFSFKKE